MNARPGYYFALALALTVAIACLAGCGGTGALSQAECDTRYTETEARQVAACAAYEWVQS